MTINDERQEADNQTREPQLGDAREHWRRAREELRAAFNSAREHRQQAHAAGKGDAFDDALQDMVDSAQDFARDLGGEARRLANEFWTSSKPHLQRAWREQFEANYGKNVQDHWVFSGRRFRHLRHNAQTNPFVGSLLSRGGGLLALYALHLLNEAPRHGNELMREIEHRTAGSWSSNPGAMYPLLSIMEEKDLVTSQWEDADKRTRRIYQITTAGTEELVRLRRVLRPRLMEAIEVLNTIFDDIYREETVPREESVNEGVSTTGPADSAASATPTPPWWRR